MEKNTRWKVVAHRRGGGLTIMKLRAENHDAAIARFFEMTREKSRALYTVADCVLIEGVR